MTGRLQTAGLSIGQFSKHVWPFALILGVWQAWISLGHVSPLVAASPDAVFRDVISNPGVYASNGIRTLLFAGGGLAIGTICGTLFALLSWFSRLLAGLLAPSIVVSQSVPFVAVVPIVAGVLGYSSKSVLVATALISVFPSYVFVTSGLRALPLGSDDLFTVLGASRRTVLLRLALPAAVPNFLVALRLNAGLAIIAAIVGEYLMGQPGLGWLFTQSFARAELPRAWGASLLIVAFSVLAYAGANRLLEAGRERWSAVE